MKERTKNILGVMVFLLIELLGIVLLNYRLGKINADTEVPAQTQTVNYTVNK